MPRQCIFCDQRADTKEDAWPVWLVEALRSDNLVIVTRPGGKDSFRQDDIVIRIGVVCGACNHGWMSRLESAAKPLLLPMIHGQSVAFDTAARATITSWAIKTAMVFEHTWGKVFPPYWRQEERIAFAKPPHAPPDLQDSAVWVASYAGTKNIAGVRVGSRTLKPLHRDGPIVPRCTIALQMGRLVLQLDTDRWREFTGNRGLALGDPLRDRGDVIWPRPGDQFTWPSQAPLSDDELNRFTHTKSAED